jgi:hypothetical protein
MEFSSIISAVPVASLGWSFSIGLLIFIVIYVLMRLVTEKLEHRRYEKNQKKK